MNSISLHNKVIASTCSGNGGSGKGIGSVTMPLIIDRELTKPKRPLSAYNFFYKIERAKILGLDVHETIEEERRGLNSRPVKKARKHRKTPGMIGFKELAKKVSSKWRNMSKEERQPYQNMFEEDRERYQREMMAWTTCQPVREEWQFKADKAAVLIPPQNGEANQRSEGSQKMPTDVFSKSIGYVIADWRKTCPTENLVQSYNSAFDSCSLNNPFNTISPSMTPRQKKPEVSSCFPRPNENVNALILPQLVSSSALQPNRILGGGANLTHDNSNPTLYPSSERLWHCNYANLNSSDVRENKVSSFYRGSSEVSVEMQLSPIVPYDHDVGVHKNRGTRLNEEDLSDLEEDLAALCEDEALTGPCTIVSRYPSQERFS